MKTIEKRKELIESVMREFEKNHLLNWPYLAGFYSQLLANMAADKPKDVQYLIDAMQMSLKSK